MPSSYRRQLEEWLKNVEVDVVSVYDIGGKQGPVKDRVKTWNVESYKILDLPEYDLNRPWDIIYDAEEFDLPDVIFCLEVFEYIYDPATALSNISWLMREQALAYITFPFVYPHHNELEFDTLRYTEPGIRRLAKHTGLKVANIWYRYADSNLLNDFWRAEGMKAAKQYPRHNVTGFIVEFTV